MAKGQMLGMPIELFIGIALLVALLVFVALYWSGGGGNPPGGFGGGIFDWLSNFI